MVLAARGAALATAGLVVMLIAAVLAPVIAPQNPYDLAQLNLLDAGIPPLSRSMDGQLFLLGSDEQGRDILSAILYGLRISLFVAAIATLFAATVGVCSVVGRGVPVDGNGTVCPRGTAAEDQG